MQALGPGPTSSSSLAQERKRPRDGHTEDMKQNAAARGSAHGRRWGTGIARGGASHRRGTCKPDGDGAG